jgi:WD40 repeat protein
MRRVPLPGLAFAIAVLAGCSPPAEPTHPAPPADPQAGVRAELAQRDAELAATKAQIEKLRRQLDDRHPAPPPTAEITPPAPTAGPDGLAIIARKRLHDGPVTSIAFDPDGKTVASTDTLGWVVVAGADDLKPVWSSEAATGTGVQNCAHSICFGPDGKYLAAGSEDRTVWVWRAGDGGLVKRIRGHQDAVEYVAFMPDGIGGLSFDRQGVGLAWSVQGERRELIPDRPLRKAALTADGEVLAWSDGGKTVCGPPSKATSEINLGGTADALAISRDGTVVAKGATAGNVELWDAQTGVRKWSGPTQPGRVQALAFSGNGKRLVSLSGGAMSVWDVKTGDETHRYRARPEEGATRLALAADGRTVAVGNRRGIVTVIRLPD